MKAFPSRRDRLHPATHSIASLVATFGVILAISIFTMTPSKALADQRDYEDPCSESGAIGQGQCAREKLDASASEMEAAYSALFDALRPDEPDNQPRRLVQIAQQQWRASMLATCDFEGEILGGARSWKSTMSVYCQADLTRKRAEQLQQYLRCVRNGGPDCWLGDPVPDSSVDASPHEEKGITAE